MSPTEIVSALALLPDDAQVTLTVRKGDLVRALEQRAGGPEVMTTTEAARTFGYEGERWRRWASSGKIAGAWQDAKDGPWHLPRASCDAHIRSLQRTGIRRERRNPAASLRPIHQRLPRAPRQVASLAQSPRPRGSRPVLKVVSEVVSKVVSEAVSDASRARTPRAGQRTAHHEEPAASSL